MGYTHYMTTKKEIPEKQWKEVVIPGVKMILEAAQAEPVNLKIVGICGTEDTLPDYGKQRIMFNGLGEDSHETMTIERVECDFYFCKTARKPYDAACVAVLVFMATCFKSYFSWNSDGDLEDGFKAEGLAILALALPYLTLDRKSLLQSLKESLTRAGDLALQERS